MPLGVSTELWIELENTGGLAWLPGETFVAPTAPRDEASLLYDAAWPSTTRAATGGPSDDAVELTVRGVEADPGDEGSSTGPSSDTGTEDPGIGGTAVSGDGTGDDTNNSALPQWNESDSGGVAAGRLRAARRGAWRGSWCSRCGDVQPPRPRPRRRAQIGMGIRPGGRGRGRGHGLGVKLLVTHSRIPAA